MTFRSSQPRYARFCPSGVRLTKRPPDVSSGEPDKRELTIEHAHEDILDLIARAAIESGGASTAAVHRHLQSEGQGHG